MDVALLWFQCKDANCNYIPLKNKKDKVKRYWKYGQSINKSARQRLFMRYVEGHYIYKNNGDLIIFECKHGTIYLHDKNESHNCNDYFYPIKDKELCNPCIARIKNESALFQ